MARFLSLIIVLAATTGLSATQGTERFIELVGKICQTPCGVDAQKDQTERELTNEWIIALEKTDPKTYKTAIKDISTWIDEDSKRQSPKLTPEKKQFILARLKERKSPLILRKGSIDFKY